MAEATLRAAVFALGCMLGSAAWAQSKPATDGKSATDEQAKQWAERASRLALAEARAYDIHLGSADGPRLELSEKPVLKWSNTYDASTYGSAFVWMRSGRPQVIACIFKFYTTKTDFDAEFHSLAAGPLTAVKKGHIVWQPSETGADFKPLADATAPAKNAAGRLTQMREIARNFSADLVTVLPPKTKHHLRLLPQPLLRYGGRDDRGRGDSAGMAELLDGALFAFARETDPDVVLMLEARGAKAPRWEYAVVRMHVGALYAGYRGKEVWSVEELTHPYLRKTERYTLFQKLPEPKVD